MPTFDKLGEIDWAVLLAVILPGFVSIHVNRMIRPGEQVPIKDLLADALFFGLLNAALVGYPLASLANKGPEATYSALVLGVFIAPAFWPFLVAGMRRLLVERGNC